MIPAPIRKLNLWLRANASYLSLTVIILCFGSILLMLASNQHQQQLQADNEAKILIQIKDITDQLSKNAATRTDQINGIDRHLDCIVAFFAQPDRANKSITDIDTCELQDTNTGTQTVTPTPAPVSNSSTTLPTPTLTTPAPVTDPTPTPVDQPRGICTTPKTLLFITIKLNCS